MYKLFIVSIYFLFITGCNSQKVVKNTTQDKEFEKSNSEVMLQQKIKQSNFKNPKTTYNSNKSYALCTNEFQGSRLASRIDFFIYDLKNNILIEEGSIIGDVYWEDDFTIILDPYVGMVQENTPINNTKKSVKKIHLNK
ncbi:hypothetical protein UJ101_00847 [Flavobacteriaceae bacterium UJ101]|nr:hypothetical protein UJ101_00847 [Flavobacteriaceae bacterium UJ101]